MNRFKIKRRLVYVATAVLIVAIILPAMAISGQLPVEITGTVVPKGQDCDRTNYTFLIEGRAVKMDLSELDTNLYYASSDYGESTHLRRGISRFNVVAYDNDLNLLNELKDCDTVKINGVLDTSLNRLIVETAQKTKRDTQFEGCPL